MRGRLAAGLVAIGAGIAFTAQAAAQQSGGEGGGGGWGSDGRAGGGIIGDEAEVWAEDGADLGPAETASTGGGDVVCRLTGVDGASLGLDLYDPPPEAVGQSVEVYRLCSDASTGEYVSGDLITVTLPLSAVPPPDPQDLAVMARGRLPFPLPEVSFSPPLDDPEDFLLTQLETWIRVDNWEPSSRSASAGGVTATVTATPVRQLWDFDPATADPALEGGCEAQGAVWDPALSSDEQSTECSFTFVHSSAGRPFPYLDAFEANLTVVYEIAWTSNVGAGGGLGEVSRTTVMPVRVGEQQALNESGGTNQ